MGSRGFNSRPFSLSRGSSSDNNDALVDHDQLEIQTEHEEEDVRLRNRSFPSNMDSLNRVSNQSMPGGSGSGYFSFSAEHRSRSLRLDSSNIPSHPSPLVTPTRSSADLPNQMANTSAVNHEPFTYRELHENGLPPMNLRREQWEGNYKEAAIFLEEGENNDKFSHHPRSREALPAYLLVHNAWFHLLDLGASLLLLALGLFESPTLSMLEVPTQVHGTIELCALTLIGVQMGLKTRWIGWKTFFKHKRTFIKVSTLVIMFMEAVTVLIRGNNHFRVTRALRPIFLIDNHYCGGVRRFIRQILQSLPPILDMLGLVFFVMLIYSVFGFYLFSRIDPENFESLVRSFISLFVLLTTANYPDVMMKSYNSSRWSAAFFISYLTINLYFLMNLMLAVVYDAFTRIEKEKFRRLFLHKRKAAQHAFRLLVTKERPEEVSFQHFEGLLSAYKPSATPTEAYLIFKLLNKSKTGYLNIDEFYDVYDACVYSWSVGKSEVEWYSTMGQPIHAILHFINRVVVSTWFEYVVYFFVLSNGIILIVQTAMISSVSKDSLYTIYAPWVSYFFIALYTFEASFKLLGLGFTKYFSSYWNVFDLCVTFLGILSLIFEFLGIPLTYIIILRPLRLLTLFRMKKRFRDVFGTAVILIPRLTSAIIVLLLIYYFFAIIGMECFHDIQLKNCCLNTTVEEFFKYEEDSNSNAYYYLNNFNSLPISGVTLFELTVVNNWFIIMEGHAHVTTEWSRIFFMTFYVFTMIVMTIIVAFILEAFLFRIQYKEFLTKKDEIKKLSAEIHISSAEVQTLMQRSNPDAGPPNQDLNALFRFVGVKSRTKEQLQRLMYHEEMEDWMANARIEDMRLKARLELGILEDTIRNEEESEGRLDWTATDLSASISSQNSTLPNAQIVLNGSEIVQVVIDDDDQEVTTIRRPVLPDVQITRTGSVGQ